MPRCQNQHLDFTNHQIHHIDASDHHGDPNQAAMTLEGGNVRPSKGGLKLAVAKSKDGSGGGTTLSTTRYFYYGRTTVVMRHENHQGIVASFDTLSPTRDEIDWEMTTANAQNAQSNYYYHWNGDAPNYDNGQNANVPSGFTTKDWHAYTIDWSPSRLNFEIDGTVVRTLERSSTKNSAGAYDYPSTPSRIQLGIWDSDGSPPGMVYWTGGSPNWSQADSHGEFTAEFKSLDIQCNDPSHIDSGDTAYQWSKTMSKTYGQPKVLGTKKSSVVN